MSDGKKGAGTLVTVLVVVGAVLLGAVFVVGILAAFGIAGVRSYLTRAKSVEGKSEVHRLAQGIVRCAEAGGVTGTASMPTLPPSAPPVPASLSDVRGKKYMSNPSDWAAPAYTCAAFSMSMPQYFQYEWLQTGPSTGKVSGRADLNGDGSVDQELSVVVSCTGSSCTAPMPTGP